jgi:hypothetical protein
MNDDQFFAWLRRQDKPKSQALERHRYQDPAKHIKFEKERGGRMQRDIDEVEVLLDLWADWMRKPEGPDGYRIAAGFVPGSLKDSEDLYEAADQDRIERVNAAFDSLQPIYKEAIMRKYGLGSQVWRFAKAASFEDAKIVMRVKLVAKGLL